MSASFGNILRSISDPFYSYHHNFILNKIKNKWAFASIFNFEYKKYILNILIWKYITIQIWPSECFFSYIIKICFEGKHCIGMVHFVFVKATVYLYSTLLFVWPTVCIFLASNYIFDPLYIIIWSKVYLFGPKYFYLVQSIFIWSKVYLFGLKCIYLVQSVFIWSKVYLFGPKCIYLVHCILIWSTVFNLAQYLSIWTSVCLVQIIPITESPCISKLQLYFFKYSNHEIKYNTAVWIWSN